MSSKNKKIIVITLGVALLISVFFLSLGLARTIPPYRAETLDDADISCTLAVIIPFILSTSQIAPKHSILKQHRTSITLTFITIIILFTIALFLEISSSSVTDYNFGIYTFLIFLSYLFFFDIPIVLISKRLDRVKGVTELKPTVNLQ